jgi:hypothetical protein
MTLSAEEQICVDYLLAQVKEAPLDDDRFVTAANALRFARARDCNCEKALDMFEATIRWRREYAPHRITAADVAGSLALKNNVMAGRCKKGNAVMYFRPGTFNPNVAADRIKYVAYLLEEAARQGYEQLTWVMDWRLFGKRSADPESSETRKGVVKLFQDHYPERLGAMYMVQQPWFISAFYYLSAPFVDSRTRAKVHIGYTCEKLKEVIDESELIDFCGGQRASGLTPEEVHAADPAVDESES